MRKKKKEKSTITSGEYHTLLGLQKEHNHHREILDQLENAAKRITGEDLSKIGSHTEEFMWGERDMGKLLELLNIEVE